MNKSVQIIAPGLEPMLLNQNLGFSRCYIHPLICVLSFQPSFWLKVPWKV